MADDKNFANIERKESIIGNLEIKKNKEVINSAEGENFFAGVQKTEQLINEASSDLSTEGEFGNVQPIGGFVSHNTKRQKDIENLMSHDLKDIYLNLAPNKQQEFKSKGEETAREINNLLDKAKLEVGKIIDLLRKWLYIIPGVNKFFIEQEVKIKADEIIRLKS